MGPTLLPPHQGMAGHEFLGVCEQALHPHTFWRTWPAWSCFSGAKCRVTLACLQLSGHPPSSAT
jgi:hypothetical protein